MSTSIYTLRAEAAAKAEELLAALDKAGIRYKVTSTRRTTDEQIAFWCQGRASLEVVQLLRKHAGLPKLDESENKYTITQIDGVNKASAHQDGRALDIAVVTEEGNCIWLYKKYAKQYRTIIEIARKLGWSCGGDWPPLDPETQLGQDPPHFQIPAFRPAQVLAGVREGYKEGLGKEPA